jgi:ABC-2 type transport system permease protein
LSVSPEGICVTRERGGAHPPLVELTLARLREFVREPEALFWVFVFPVLMACALGVAFRARGDEAIIAGVLDGPGRARVEAALADATRIQLVTVPSDQLGLVLQRAEVQIVIEGLDPPVYHYDPTRTESRLARGVVDDALQRAAGRVDRFEAVDAHVEAVGARYIDWLLPGLLGMTVMSTGLWGIAFSIVVARTRKLLKRLVASPMRKRDYLLAQVLGRLVFLGPEVGLLLVFGAMVFGVPQRGAWWLLAGTCLLGAIACGGLGLLMASRARTIEAVSGLINLVMLPMWVLSGVFFSSANFPAPMQPFIQALPLTALNDALRAVMLEGAGFRQIAGELAILSSWGLGAFALALRLFRWR